MYLKSCGGDGGKENKSLLFWKIKECNMYLQYIFHTFAILIYSKILSGWKKILQRPICNNLHLQVRGPIFFELSQGCGILTNDEIGKQDIIKKSTTRNQNKKDDDKW